jgi:hypothetical protein
VCAQIFAEGDFLLARTAAALSVLHAPDLLAARMHLDVEAAAVGDLVAALFCLQSLEFRVVERHACPLQTEFRALCKTDSVPHAIF